jgi:hypothetical protein
MTPITLNPNDAQHFNTRLTAEEWALHLSHDKVGSATYMHSSDVWLVTIRGRESGRFLGYMGKLIRKPQTNVT